MNLNISLKTRPMALVNFRNLTSRPDEPVEDIMRRIASGLSGLGTNGSVEIQLTGGDAQNSYFLGVTPSGVTLLDAPIKDATLVATMPMDLFHSIAQGSHSPQQAYIDGILKLRGNVELARQIVRRLAASPTAATLCPFLMLEGYDPVRGNGSMLLHGAGFTAFGSVQLSFDYGGDTPSNGAVDADDTGSFDYEQLGIPCGDLFGDPTVGVIVKAVDLQSNQFTQQKFRTPC